MLRARRRRVSACAATIALAGVVTACGGGRSGRPHAHARPTASTRAATTTTTVPAYLTTVAEATVPTVGIYDSATAPTASRTLQSPTSTGAPLVFLVERTMGAACKSTCLCIPTGAPDG